ncbi:hypothetical protein LR48_Vigan06g039700 [Vigna angularis]|uniref:Uncharacterized protein n=1 Tax=Phaseolus angularis TaxID=3914 RepID=A0A0L9UQW1_PHAAN|nr:hypothetical protein LR48_Vigan06g039700 [Vigna angularis]
MLLKKFISNEKVSHEESEEKDRAVNPARLRGKSLSSKLKLKTKRQPISIGLSASQPVGLGKLLVVRSRQLSSRFNAQINVITATVRQLRYLSSFTKRVTEWSRLKFTERLVLKVTYWSKLEADKRSTPVEG